MPPTLTITPRQGAAPTAVGAATRAIPTRQRWPKGSAVDLTVAPVVDRDGTPRAAAVVRCSLTTLTGGLPVAAVTDVLVPPVSDVPGAYRATVPAQTVDALPLGVYVLTTLIDPADPALRQELTGEVEVLEAQGVPGLGAPFATRIVEVPAPPTPIEGALAAGTPAVTLELSPGAATRKRLLPGTPLLVLQVATAGAVTGITVDSATRAILASLTVGDSVAVIATPVGDTSAVVTYEILNPTVAEVL